MRMVTSQRSFSSANQRVRPTTALNSNHIYFYDQQFNYFPGQRGAFGSTEGSSDHRPESCRATNWH